MIHTHVPGVSHSHKSIGRFGSVCLIANNVVGPAMVSIGTSYAQAGWLPTTSLLLLCSVLTIMSSHFLCETIQAVPGNRGFDKRIELTDADVSLSALRGSRYFFGSNKAVYCRLRGRQVVARVGGGWINLVAYLKQHENLREPVGHYKMFS